MKSSSCIVKKIKGFSLVEILVVLGLFSAIATLSLGALFNVQSVNVRLQETQIILDNMNLSSQTIMRDIRFGAEFHCASPLPSTIPTVRKNCTFKNSQGGTSLIFKPSDATNDLDRIAFYVQNGVLYKGVYPYLGLATVLQMTSDDVTISSLIFYVDGAQTSDGSSDDANAIDYQQPIITIILSGVTRPVKTNTPPSTFEIQTAISARELDNK